MAAFISRMFIFWLSGWLMSSGWINDELRQVMTSDPEIANSLQIFLSGAAAGIWWAWWRLAKRWEMLT